MIEYLKPGPGEIQQSKEATRRLFNSIADSPVPERRVPIGFNFALVDVGTPQVFRKSPSINNLNIVANEAAGTEHYAILPGRISTVSSDGEPGANPSPSGGY